MSTHESKLEKKRENYRRNQGSERHKALERARRRRASLSLQQIAQDKENHRQAQARYRERNRDLLAVRAVQYRLLRKRQLAIERDEEEYQRLWNMASESQEPTLV